MSSARSETRSCLDAAFEAEEQTQGDGEDDKSDDGKKTNEGERRRGKCYTCGEYHYPFCKDTRKCFICGKQHFPFCRREQAAEARFANQTTSQDAETTSRSGESETDGCGSECDHHHGEQEDGRRQKIGKVTAMIAANLVEYF